MPSRRDFLLAAAMCGAAGTAWALTPRRRQMLLGDRKLDELIPKAIPGWQALRADGIVTPVTEGSLQDRLYEEPVGRIFADADGEAVMLLVAYGSTQSDELQLHRPESCYPAVGFTISGLAPESVMLTPDIALPSRRLSARLDSRVEQVLYWTRIGEYLPNSAAQQRDVRFRIALDGIVPDGVLVRISSFSRDMDEGARINERFARDLIANLGDDGRRVLLGSAMTRRLSGRPPTQG